jgi:serine/threonine protein kinase
MDGPSHAATHDIPPLARRFMAMDTRTSLGEDRLGGFRVIRTIHPGVSTMVLEVVQDSTGKRFAIKQLLESRAEDPAERRQFEFEARIGLSLNHPNLVRYHEYIKDPDAPYIVMDFFPGRHLKLAVSKPQDYPWLRGKLHSILTQAANGLAYMHDQGWIHRDVKPENVMANKTGEVRVIDYTITRRPVIGLGALFKKKMKARQGTASYMSPEQISLATPTVAADVYCFGCTCYELACGRPPVRANSTSELLGKHMREKPAPPTVYNKDVTPEFSELVLQTLHKDPAARPSDLRDFLARFSRIRVYNDDAPPAREGF